MVESAFLFEPRTRGGSRGMLGLASALASSALLLALVLVSLSPGEERTVLEGKGRGKGRASQEHARWQWHHADSSHSESLASEKRLVAREQALVERERPRVASTEDTYVAARGRVSSLKAREADEADASTKLDLEEKDDNSQVQSALLARSAAMKKAAAKLTAMKQAQAAQHTAESLDDKALRDKANSEKDEAEGIAIQEPAAALLKDSRKLNDQSNLVLDQSHSSQAKALAALDLNLAQNLATRASQGMHQAKDYFSRAIAERKRAVAADQLSAQEDIDAAKLSLKVNHEVPALLHVMHGQETGEAGLRAVIGADADAVDEAENRLGEDREAVRSAYEHRTDTIRKVEIAKKQADSLRAELIAAQKAVVQAAKAHLVATKKYKEAAAARQKALERSEEMQAHQSGDLSASLKAAEAARDSAVRSYKDATAKVSSLSGKQTLLEMQVARLKLQLKEAEMQRASLKEKNERERESVSHLRTRLEEEDSQLNSARLQLADARIGSDSGAGVAAQPVIGGRGRIPVSSVHDEAARAEGEAYDGADPVARERLRERRLRDEQSHAQASAQEEERKLKLAQRAVEQQMEKVRKLETSV